MYALYVVNIDLIIVWEIYETRARNINNITDYIDDLLDFEKTRLSLPIVFNGEEMNKTSRP
jgi:hypothetical protein